MTDTTRPTMSIRHRIIANGLKVERSAIVIKGRVIGQWGQLT